MLGILDNLMGVIVKPVPTFRSMLEAPRLIEALLVVLIASFCSGLAALLSPLLVFPRLLPSPALTPTQAFQFLFSPAFLIPLSIISGAFSWIIISAVFHASSRVLGGKGNFEQTLLIAGFSQAPLIYSIFFGVLSWAVGSTLPTLLSSFLLGIWSLILLVLGIREAHKFSTLRALAAIFLPIIVIAVVIIVIVVALVLILIPRLPYL
ncbi:MAG: Yip1 domain protein [Candidatus Bathyarchaeota archaeon BA1]|nr:MAG: Yip1 domain protein [Candidatus Bathyarchaeota archaeon BA1]